MSTDSPTTPVKPYVGRGPRGMILADEARELLKECEASGSTLTEFAGRKGLDPQRLSWWKGRLGLRKAKPRPTERARSAKAPRATPRILPVISPEDVRSRRAPHAASPEVARTLPFEIVLGDAVVRVAGDFRDDTLARLLRVVRGAR